MKKIKIIYAILAVILFAMTAFVACSESVHPFATNSADCSAVDSAAATMAENSVLEGLSANVDTAGAVAVSDGDVTITESGSYIFSGNYEKIKIAESELTLHFFFKNAQIICGNGVAIDGLDVKKTNLTLTLCDETLNTVSADTDNAVHIKGNLDINGKGSLRLTSGKNDVKVTKSLRIVSCNLELSAANHAISALSVAASDCRIKVIAAGKDGIHCECDDETSAFTLAEGFAALRNVNYSCEVAGDGIQADTVVYIDGGDYDITTHGKFVQDTAENRELYGLTSDDFRYIKMDDEYKKVASDYYGRVTMYALSQGCKGIKAGEIEYPDPENADEELTVKEGDYCIVINSGTIVVNSTDDGIHANSGSVKVNGGEIDIQTLDDGITADVLAKIVGGKINVSESYEGLEAGYVEILGGDINIVASDDGINAASDKDSVDEYVLIGGGTITVNAQGDGIDSNGSLEISGGTVNVYGPMGGGDGGLDSETGIYINGGTLFVTAFQGMTELPRENSAQCVLAYGQTKSIAAGALISVKDGNGKTIAELTAKKDCQTVIFSSSELRKGKTYAVYADGVKIGEIKLNSQVSSTGIEGGFGGAPDTFPPPGPQRPGPDGSDRRPA